ncbi:MAG: hypothetical protein U0V74_14345 [Chitinophagales bacterium]
MKVNFMVLLAFMAWHINANAQSCCCTSSGANWSILPNAEKHLIGLRYAYKSFYSVYPKSLNPELSGQRTQQTLNSAELFGRFYLAKPLQLTVQLPVNFISENTAKGTNTQYGLGDISFLLQYSFLDPKRCNGKPGKHQFKLGAGVKLPSGSFRITNTSMFLTSQQLGTGSVDFLFNAVYTYRYKQFGFNLSSAYKLNTTNPQQYKFGDRLQGALNFFYAVPVKEVTLTPSVSLNYDHGFYNVLRKQKMDYTGGDFLTTSAGFDIFYKQFAFSSSFTPALMNRLNWSGETRQKFTVEAGIFYNFQTKTSNKQNEKPL